MTEKTWLRSQIPAAQRDRLDAAIACARDAGSLLLASRGQVLQVKSKGLNDVATHIDLASEKLIVDTLKSRFPEDGFLGEENGQSGNSDAGRWIIDPIDGTDNFIHGIPDYTVSIAFQNSEGVLTVGVVNNPEQDELFYAAKDMGAYRNDTQISVSEIKDPSRALNLSAPPFRIHEKSAWYFSLMQRISLQTWDDRNFGSAALHLAYVACGRADSFYELGLKPYDIAAGVLILQEAGGRCTGFSADENFMDTGRVVATNGLLHDWYLKQIKEFGES